MRYEVSIGTGAWTTAQSMSGHTFSVTTSGSHNFRVRAVNSAGAGSMASMQGSPLIVSAPTLSTPTFTLTANAAQRNSSALLRSSITNTGGATITARGFWIRESTQSGHDEFLANAPTSPFERTILDLRPGSRYHIRAFARNNAVQGSGLSSEVIINVPAIAPVAPRNFNNSVSGRSVNLTWLAPLDTGGIGLTRYEVSHNGGSWTTVQGVLSLNHTFNNLSYGAHVFRVRAVNAVGASPYARTDTTIVAAATVPGAPQNFNALPGNSVVALTWSAPASNGGAAITEYEVSHNNGAWVTAQSMTSHTVNNLLPETHHFRVRAVNSVGAGIHASTSATIESPNQPPTPPPAQAGINVTVVDGNGRPIQGALVQFLVREATLPQGVNNRNTTFTTNASGIAVFPNIGAGTYGINVTHRNFASTSATSREIHRTSGNQTQNETFIMSESSTTFRNFGWRPVLADMGTPANPNIRISSVYGWRRFYNNGIVWQRHEGIDLAAINGVNAGRRIYSAFTGEVVQVFTDPSRGAGYGVNVRFRDDRTDTYFFLRYMHMQSHSRVTRNGVIQDVAYGMTINAGEHIGYLGNTGNSTGPHLHIDVHRHNARTFTSGWAHTIDPRAFFAYGFAEPWRYLNVQR